MSEDVAIKVSNVSKKFKLPHENHNSLKGKLINFHKRGYEIQEALNDISFDVKKGEFFGIVGRNGSGKSTLLKILAGIYTPNQGSVEVNGKLTPFIELGVGFNHELSGRDNVFLNGALLGFTRPEMEEMYDEIVEFAELERFMDQKLKNYSSGMQVRLAFSIAIRANTDILVLDEVLAVGDANFQKKCFDYFAELKKEKKTVILVSHDMDSVKRFCTRAMLIENGKHITTGSPEKVSEEYLRRNEEAAQPSRQKNGAERPKVKINAIRLVDEKEKQIFEAKDKGKFGVKIDYVIFDPPEAVNFSVGLWSVHGSYVFGCDTVVDKHNLETSNGTGSATLMFDNPPLLPGSYYVNVSCFEESEDKVFDIQEKVINFIFSNENSQAKYRGVANLSHNWSSKR